MHTLILDAAPPGPQCQAAMETLRLPNLERLLQLLSPDQQWTGTDKDLSPVAERAMAHCAGLPQTDGLIPWAAHDAQQRGLAKTHGLENWAWITPAHWQAQSDHVEMSDPMQLGITHHEAIGLHAAMLPYFAEDGITLYLPEPGQSCTHWLAQGAVFANLPTASLQRVAGQRVDPWVPRQAQAAPLRRLQNEMQMLLYTHPLNDLRASMRQPSINAFWVSGTGTLPAALPPARPYVLREALHASARHDDAPAWMAAWEALDASTLAHELERLERGEAAQLTLCSATLAQHYTLRPLGTWERLRRRFAPLRAASALQSLRMWRGIIPQFAPRSWDALQGAGRAVWPAKQAACNAAARPNPPGQMGKLFLATS